MSTLYSQRRMTTSEETAGKGGVWYQHYLPFHLLCLVIQSCLTLCNPSVHGDSPSKDTGVGCHALLQGIFPTQGSNPGLLCCMWILYCLCHQGSQRILIWVAYFFSSGSSQPRKQIRISCIAGGFLPTKLPGMSLVDNYSPCKNQYQNSKVFLVKEKKNVCESF